MNTISKIWQIASPITPKADRELQRFPRILRQILFNRGYATEQSAVSYIQAKTPEGTDSNNLPGMSEAIDRIRYAIDQQEKIAVYGDYDVDGVTATTLLVDFLRKNNADVIGYIPNRFDEGYGLNVEALTGLREGGIELVITVDCGIRSIYEAGFAKQSGLDLIITDHHHPGSEIPTAIAIINPKLPNSAYPDKNLAGVGLAYKLASAMKTEQLSPSYKTSFSAHDYLDLVALGTVADLAPLIGENRALVSRGLEQIQRTRRQGILSLIGASGLNPQRITANSIGYILGPRLNAAGRLESALAALDLLLTDDLNEAGKLAQMLSDQNKERQQKTKDLQEQAEKLAFEEERDPLILFAIDPEFNPGIIGLAASRLQERYYRPAIVAQKGDEITRGSCRSIPEFHITDALDQCADILVHHGGHAAAAGFTIHNQDLEELIERLKVIAENQLGNLELTPSLYADMELPLSSLKPALLEHLSSLEPTGYGNPQAIFISRGLKVRRYRTVGKDGGHLKLTVTDGKITYDAIAFRQGFWAAMMQDFVDLLFHYELNEYNGKQNIQLNVRDIKPVGQ
jgi:single-stranded-DNA-specific exonuclease